MDFQSKTCFIVLILLFQLNNSLTAQTLDLPMRKKDAPNGAEIVEKIRFMDREFREQAILNEIQNGNIPDFLRTLIPVMSKYQSDSIQFYVLPDYLSVGSNTNFFYVPLTPTSAQKLATFLSMSLPTSKMVDLIYQQAQIKLKPQPIPPTDSMTTVSVFWVHNQMIVNQMKSLGIRNPHSKLIAGHKKDVIISNRIYQKLKKAVPNPVVIYGWHESETTPIQPIYNGHSSSYADYSHGIRFVCDTLLFNGKKVNIRNLLASDSTQRLINYENPILKAYYEVE